MLQAEFWSHEILEIADDSAGDFIINEHGDRVVDHENINRARLRVDTRKWLLSKLLPKKYGERVQADVTVRRVDQHLDVAGGRRRGALLLDRF